MHHYDAKVIIFLQVVSLPHPGKTLTTANMLFGNTDNEYVVFGGGHAATIAVRATKSGSLKPKAIAAVAPTWAGPLPIVFGRDSNMETRYGLLRGTLRAPAVGWMMYNVLVSNEKAIQSQYKSHVYADPENVTPSIVESRYELTKRKGSPKRSKAEMEALQGAKGVSKFVEVPGALLPQEEYPKAVADELYRFLLENFESKA
ncbi:UNVERIFIED_CONTAM: hypothetical protein Sradi_2887500 [Sesamum radiatum]|uniref:Uncharacterized protein n=1 Tax=Sesamum radiatum TaxID=300843 RepID=A0AAW2RXJ3_SESRA